MLISWSLLQNTRLQDTLYDLPWTAYSVPERRMILFMLLFTSTQKIGFSAHKYIYCNIETFGMVSMTKSQQTIR